MFLSENGLLIEHIACAVRERDEECLSKEPSILVCQECGSREIQMMAWVDPNTLEYVSSIDADADDQWCDACQEHVWFCSLEEFGDNLDAWWLAVDFPKMERITGLSAANYPADDGGQAFLDACNAWWKALDYERKRAIWMENDQSRTEQHSEDESEDY